MRKAALRQTEKMLDEDGWELCFSFDAQDRRLHYYSKGRLHCIVEEDDQEANVYLGCPFSKWNRVMQWLENVVGTTRDMIEQ